MSNDTVTFHYVTPGQMYMFDFLLYRLNRHWSSSSVVESYHIVVTTVPTITTSYKTRVLTNWTVLLEHSRINALTNALSR